MGKKKIKDVTDVMLTPGNMEKCLGNGEHLDKKGNVIECCCDECDYLLLCLKNAGKYDEE